VEAIVEGLPDRFLTASVSVENGTMASLQSYMRDLADYLRQVTGDQEPPITAVMAAIGIPPSAWYRAAFAEIPPPGILDGPQAPFMAPRALSPKVLEDDAQAPEPPSEPEGDDRQGPSSWVFDMTPPPPRQAMPSMSRLGERSPIRPKTIVVDADS
jgi:hypothetical protein